MNQDGTSTPDTPQSGSQQSDQLPSGSKTLTATKPSTSSTGTLPPARTTEITVSRIILFSLLVILLLAFVTNTTVVGIILGVFALLSISIFQPLFNKVLDGIDSLIARIPTPTIGTKPSPSTRKAFNLSYFAKHLMNISMVIVIILLGSTILRDPIAYHAGNINNFLCLKSSLWPVCDSGIGISSLPTPDSSSITIGLISEANKQDIPFDKSDIGAAGDESYVEHKILTEDDHACVTPHITLAIVTMLSRTITDTTVSSPVGLQDLQGAFLAQAAYNADKTNNTKLCLVIANIGTQKTADRALPQVVKQLLLYARADPTLRGIVGFPFSVHVQDAIAEFQSWPHRNIPFVSPSATSDTFSSINNFYRIVSPDRVQSQEIAQFIKQNFIPSSSTEQTAPTIAVFRDSSGDPYSISLADDFTTAIQPSLPFSGHIVPEFYTLGNAESITSKVHDAIANQHANLIFFAGYSNDIDAVETGVQAEQQQIQQSSPTRTAPASIPIFGGDGLYDLTRFINNTHSIVYSTVYAPPLKNSNKFCAGIQ